MNMDQDQENNEDFRSTSPVERKTSMGTLVMWNISKVLKTNPDIDLKSAIHETQERLLNKDTIIASQNPKQLHLSCAILAWQQLGHSSCDSLYKFIETKQNEKQKEIERCTESKKKYYKINSPISPGSFISYGSSKCDAGPVVKLPTDTTKIVMRLDNNQCAGHGKKSARDNIAKKIEAACCKEPACIERLSELDKQTNELRTRAERLARREAQRVEMLERAEAAWKDLEMGFQRRLNAAEEKEDLMMKSIQKIIEERNGHKNACTALVQLLREKSDKTEQERNKLGEIEKEMCCTACARLKLSEEAARVDAKLAELQCKSANLDKDLQFKEEQMYGQLRSMENEVDCSRVLTYEMERTMHSELSGLRDQIRAMSNQLLEEDAENSKIKDELDQLRREKMEIVEDLESCQLLCNGRVQGKVDELNRKRAKLRELKEKVTECQCKLPVDAVVEVKRTPSLAALCKCSPDDIMDTCSCTSLRTTLLTSLLSDLFGGLQSELSDIGSQMPCQLLKCLEENHNWDKSSVIKTNLRNYFSKLLVGELEIAIATAIEKYHARWIGASCADAVFSAPCHGSEGWQEKAIEKRAHRLAADLAEQLFQERADELTAKAKELLKAGPPPCECSKNSAAVYPCFVDAPIVIGGGKPNINQMHSNPVKNYPNIEPSSGQPSNSKPSDATGNSKPNKINTSKSPIITGHGTASTSRSNGSHLTNIDKTTPACWRKTHQDVNQLKAQIEDLKKDSIKKEDLKQMEKNLSKLVQRSVFEVDVNDREASNELEKNSYKKEISVTQRPVKADTPQTNKNLPNNKLSSIKKKQLDSTNSKKTSKNFIMGLQSDKNKKLDRAYAVNVCLCGTQKLNKRSAQKGKIVPNDLKDNEAKKSYKSNGRPSKPLITNITSDEITYVRKKNIEIKSNHDCPTEVACFHKEPSNTSIDKLLEKLAQWKCDMYKNMKNKFIHDNVGIDKIDDVAKCEAIVTKTVSTKISEKYIESDVPNEMLVEQNSKNKVQLGIPYNTESEYMGDVNLDRSNEVFSFGNDTKEPDQVLLSSNKSAVNKSKQKLANASLNIDNTPLDIPNPHILVIGQLNPDIENKCLINEQCVPRPIPDIIQKSSFANNYEYCINFLGVTLTNANPRKEIGAKCNNFQNIINSNVKQKGPYNNYFSNKTRPITDVNDMTNVQHSKNQHNPCDCTIKYDDFKQLLNQVFKKKPDFICKNEDKSIDTRSFKVEADNCICCDDLKNDESTDLEVNAFHLLENHLQDKLKEFKTNTCNSSCISSSDEQKLFSTILERVRQVITDSTGKLTCKCESKNPREVNCHRAYMLLQEYLKIKMNRVHCLCETSDDNKESVVPQIMANVFNLIDKDFQRLKSMCGCKLLNEKKEKDVSSVNNKVSQNEVSLLNSNNQTIAAFVFDLKSKHVSKQPIKEISRFVECTGPKTNENSGVSLDRNPENENDYCENQFGNIICVDAASQPNTCTDAIKSSLNENDVSNKSSFLPTEKNILPEMNEKNPPEINYPCIGYTVDCSCHGVIGTCTCTKSFVTSNLHNINDIWNSLTKKKLQTRDLSYIMKAKTNPSQSYEKLNVEVFERDKVCFVQHCCHVMCDTEVGVHEDEDITLKDSNTYLNKLFVSNTTTTSNCNLGLEVEQPTDCCTCGYSKNNLQHTENSKKSFGNSFYFPINDLKNHRINEVDFESETINLPSSISSNCDCNMVPMCHVKMLVENIEKKLIHSKCTCDSLCSVVCPVHAKRIYGEI